MSYHKVLLVRRNGKDFMPTSSSKSLQTSSVNVIQCVTTAMGNFKIALSVGWLPEQYLNTVKERSKF